MVTALSKRAPFIPTEAETIMGNTIEALEEDSIEVIVVMQICKLTDLKGIAGSATYMDIRKPIAAINNLSAGNQTISQIHTVDKPITDPQTEMIKITMI